MKLREFFFWCFSFNNFFESLLLGIAFLINLCLCCRVWWTQAVLCISHNSPSHELSDPHQLFSENQPGWCSRQHKEGASVYTLAAENEGGKDEKRYEGRRGFYHRKRSEIVRLEYGVSAVSFWLTIDHEITSGLSGWITNICFNSFATFCIRGFCCTSCVIDWNYDDKSDINK